MPSLKDENKEQSVLSDDGGSKIHNPAAVMEDEEAVNNHRSSSPVAIFSESASQPFAINNFDGTSKTTDDDVTKDYFGGDTTEAINKDGLTMEEDAAEEVEMMSGQNATSGSRRSTNEEGNNNSASSKELSSESIDESNGHDTTFGKGEMTADPPVDKEEGREHDDFTMVSSGNANHHDESSTLVNNSNHQQLLSFLPSSKQSSTNNVAFTRSSSRNEKQDDYVKKGAHVKALLASAMQAVADGFAHNNKATVEDGSSNNNNNNSSSNNGSDECGAEKKLSKKTAEDFVHMQELAQTKSEECIALKRVSLLLGLQLPHLSTLCLASFIHYYV
jgi:hypothetical protein